MIRSVRKGAYTLEYTLICAKNRSSLLLQALPGGKARLYAPKGYSVRLADRFVLEHLDELIKAQKKLEEAENRVPDTVLLRGVRLPLYLEHGIKGRVQADENGITVFSPDPNPQQIKTLLKAYLSRLALQEIKAALDKWSPAFRESYGRVTIREQRSRWGSCSAKRNLNFNWKLILAPPECLEYVVIHELAHLKVFNHSEAFWKEVKRCMPDYDIWRKWLKKHGQELTV
ncbi:MAG: M48 family metallopeptidase [Clostridiales bacterium]|nr:M48 family metallopeptidase [Clostridiales bacterium]